MFHDVSRITGALAAGVIGISLAACSGTSTTPPVQAPMQTTSSFSRGALSGGVNSGGVNSGGGATGGSASGGSATGGGGNSTGADGFKVTGLVTWTNSQGYYSPSDVYIIGGAEYHNGSGQLGSVPVGTCVQVSGTVVAGLNVIDKMAALARSKCP